jgi:hypothetical protein
MTEHPSVSLPVDHKTLMQVLNCLDAAGIEFILDQAPNDYYTLYPSEVMEYLVNPEAFLAEAAGVSVEDYQAWQAAEGAIQCHAQTKNGRRCRNLVVDTDEYLSPRQWAALQARKPTCWAHGGRALTAHDVREADQ